MVELLIAVDERWLWHVLMVLVVVVVIVVEPVLVAHQEILFYKKHQHLLEFALLPEES